MPTQAALAHIPGPPAIPLIGHTLQIVSRCVWNAAGLHQTVRVGLQSEHAGRLAG